MFFINIVFDLTGYNQTMGCKWRQKEEGVFLDQKYVLCVEWKSRSLSMINKII